ncbi:MAG: hypothetical protein P8Z35_27030, partial [Ignavibacteriaceae bacterium]
SLFIACIELVLLVNLLVFTDKNRQNFLVYLILLLLAAYQTFEYLICGIGMKSSFTTYFAFTVISFLPPLSFLLVLSWLKIKSKLKPLILLPAVFFVIYYSSVINQFAVVKCNALFATYNFPLGTLYGAFYYLPIFVSFILLVYNFKKADYNFKKADLETGKQTKLLITAHYFIIIPVVASFILLLLNLPGLLHSIESILCKFAFGYAVALGFFALNNRNKE